MLLTQCFGLGFLKWLKLSPSFSRFHTWLISYQVMGCPLLILSTSKKKSMRAAPGSGNSVSLFCRDGTTCRVFSYVYPSNCCWTSEAFFFSFSISNSRHQVFVVSKSPLNNVLHIIHIIYQPDWNSVADAEKWEYKSQYSNRCKVFFMKTVIWIWKDTYRLMEAVFLKT